MRDGACLESVSENVLMMSVVAVLGDCGNGVSCAAAAAAVFGELVAVDLRNTLFSNRIGT